jgi:hypothetical protein
MGEVTNPEMGEIIVQIQNGRIDIPDSNRAK